MPRPNVLVHGVCVLTVALVLVACGPAGPTVPPQPVYHAAPTPAKSVDPGARYAEALVAKFAGDDLAMHVEETNKLRGLYELDGANLTATTTLDVSGGDLHMRTVSKVAGKTTKIEIVVVGRTVYVRLAGHPWKKVRRADYEQDIGDAIRGLQLIRNPTYLTYVGVETIDKHKLHHLKANRKFPYLNGTASGTYDTFDVWVKEDGTPVLVKGKISAVGAYGLEIAGTNEMRFSKFGGPIKIVAPKS